MVEQILPNLYTIEVPLPGSPLKATNSYIIKADDRSLIIDTGMNREECLSVLSAGLKELDVNLAQADFFITHMHADHSGLISTLATETSTIYFGETDAPSGAMAAKHNYFEQIPKVARMQGFPEDELQKAIKNHPGYKYSARGHLEFHFVRDGDIISIGDYSFICIATPGHTNGHMCLYEPNKKIFVAGDHNLIDITPNISLWSEGDENPLGDYLASLDKVYDLDVELVLPGHRRRFKNHKQRIDELKKHHETRANEVLSILKQGSQHAYQVASQMTWDMSYEHWHEFPPSQKWFATGEALAHLKYLEDEGKIRRETHNQTVFFSLI